MTRADLEMSNGGREATDGRSGPLGRCARAVKNCSLLWVAPNLSVAGLSTCCSSVFSTLCESNVRSYSCSIIFHFLWMNAWLIIILE